MNITSRLNKLVELLTRQSAPSARSLPDAVGLALDRCLDEARGSCWHEAIFSIAREVTNRNAAGRDIDMEIIFVEAGVCGELRQQVESFMDMDTEAQAEYLDGLR